MWEGTGAETRKSWASWLADQQLILSELSYAAQTHPPRHGTAYGALGPLMSIISQDNLMDVTTGQSKQVFN